LSSQGFNAGFFNASLVELLQMLVARLAAMFFMKYSESRK